MGIAPKCENAFHIKDLVKEVGVAPLVIDSAGALLACCAREGAPAGHRHRGHRLWHRGGVALTLILIVLFGLGCKKELDHRSAKPWRAMAMADAAKVVRGRGGGAGVQTAVHSCSVQVGTLQGSYLPRAKMRTQRRWAEIPLQLHARLTLRPRAGVWLINPLCCFANPTLH